ncbi:hypothetical protein HMPREF2580_01780 [Staphylococcus sp. HMSC036D05]|uniref:hypothetical protein n=1 Tax=Staphylococcus sp. HMSC036D05 TaxID=1715059 RepID=UPI0008A8E1BB|nr:hypothetical protein [Staphylococcus sp. HMSC036D05]OHO69666.1 hypothetical protein HMPREF2580_01780 [Staphylococcus sp. HMSC036D05]
MWSYLNNEDKLKYKNLITNFASLSEAFSQKSEENNDNVAPIVNSKFQETVFQRAFGAIGEDIANTSYDASLLLDEKHKYLVGIKSFGIYSGDQKIAQFKKNSQYDNWGEILNKIVINAKSSESMEEANEKNEIYYRELAEKIAKLRNARIESSKEQIKGFKGTDDKVEAVYHVLMPSRKGEPPKIHVGETDYKPIDLNKLKIIGATKKNNPTNFKFTDENHEYKYTSADSQLYMSFNNKSIVVESWDVKYIEDPFKLFETLNEQANISGLESKLNEDDIEESISWIITDKEGKVHENSGFNGFNGAPKLSKANNYREKRIENIINTYKNVLDEEILNKLKKYLSLLLLKEFRSKDEKEEMKRIRNSMMKFIEKTNNPELVRSVEALVYRPIREMYIPLPNSKKFHNSHPDFFGENIGKFIEGTSKLLLPKEERVFKLEFLSSGDIIDAYINQEGGKSIQSYSDQQILGEWILQGVFQLKPREILTEEKLNEIGINGIRLIKFKDHNRGIGLEFIWIEPENPPKDAIGWISKK